MSSLNKTKSKMNILIMKQYYLCTVPVKRVYDIYLMSCRLVHETEGRVD